MPNEHLQDAAHFAVQFNSPAERVRVTHDLAALGERAVPILAAICSGDAKNEFGVPYRNLGQPLLCSFVTIGMLGPKARELEPFFLGGIRDRHAYAVEAIPRLGPLSDQAIRDLAGCIGAGSLVSWEAAETLRDCGQLDTPIVAEVVASSP